MELVTISAPLIIMALLSGLCGLPFAYGLLAIRDLWDSTSSTHPRYAVFITSAAYLIWLAALIGTVYLVFSAGWLKALHL